MTQLFVLPYAVVWVFDDLAHHRLKPKRTSGSARPTGRDAFPSRFGSAQLIMRLKFIF
jgi:hypothetical protein